MQQDTKVLSFTPKVVWEPQSLPCQMGTAITGPRVDIPLLLAP